MLCDAEGNAECSGEKALQKQNKTKLLIILYKLTSSTNPFCHTEYVKQDYNACT